AKFQVRLTAQSVEGKVIYTSGEVYADRVAVQTENPFLRRNTLVPSGNSFVVEPLQAPEVSEITVTSNPKKSVTWNNIKDTAELEPSYRIRFYKEGPGYEWQTEGNKVQFQPKGEKTYIWLTDENGTPIKKPVDPVKLQELETKANEIVKQQLGK